MTTSVHAAPAAPSLALPIIAVASGLAVGAATEYGQGWLGDGMGSLVNSAGPWALAATMVALGSRRPWIAAALATTVLAFCELGYALATVARGGHNAPSTVQFWLIAALMAGPPLGTAAAWSRAGTDAIRTAVGAAVLPGVLIGEAVWGLTAIADTTNRAYWTVQLTLGTAGAATAAWIAGRRATRPVLAVAATITTAGAAAAAVLAAAHLA